MSPDLRACTNVEARPSDNAGFQPLCSEALHFTRRPWQEPSLQMLYSIWKELGVTANI